MPMKMLIERKVKAMNQSLKKIHYSGKPRRRAKKAK